MVRGRWLLLPSLVLLSLTFGLERTSADQQTVVPANAPARGTGSAKLSGFIRVIDGDTLEAYIDGKRVGIGLIGVDAPMGNTSCGRQAADRLRSLVKGGLQLDEDLSYTFDTRFRRMYTATTRDGRSVAEELVGRGVARADGRGKESQQLTTVELQARSAGRGCVWSGSSSSTGDDLRANAPDGGEPAFGAFAPLESSIVAAAPLAMTLPSGFSQEVLASSLNEANAFTVLPDGRILIAEKAGVVKVVKNNSVLSTPFIDLRSRVNDYWDHGLLGIAADPGFATNGYVYLYYVYENDPAQYNGPKTARLTRVTASGDTASPSSEVVLLGKSVGSSCKNFPAGADCIPADGPSHNGGNIKFASDGTLFLTTGDATHWNIVSDDALRTQDVDTLAGKLIHVTSGGAGVAGNPFWNGNPSANRSKIWAYGLRNPFRFNLRPGSGMPYIGDVGAASAEELNVGIAGSNFGWPCYEGNSHNAGYDPRPGCQVLYSKGQSAIRFPLYTYAHTANNGAAIIGGAFYTGTAYPAQYQGAYFFTDFSQGSMQYLHVDASDKLVDGPHAFSDQVYAPDIEIGLDQNIYYLSYYSDQLLRLRYNGPPTSGSCPAGQLQVEYFPNRTLSGTPASTQCETSINHTWGTGGPAGVPADGFSARWTGQQDFAAGTYTFTATTDDGMRVWLDGTLLIDAWRDQPPTKYQVTRAVAAGRHAVKVEYYEAAGGALAQVTWQPTVAGKPPVVMIGSPSSGLTFKVGDHITFSGSATDANGATIPPTGLAWQVLLQHCPNFGSQCHTHQLQSSTGATGSFDVPDHGDGTYFEIVLTATDSGGQSASASVAIQPKTINVTLDTVPSGLQVVYVDQSGPAPFTHKTIVGSSFTIYAPSPQGSSTFKSWSDGGTQQHNVIAGSTDITYTATFVSTGCPVGQYQAEYFANRTLSGAPAATQCEPAVGHSWGTGSPAGVPVDGFSARWTGQQDFAGGTYTFTATADDGIRVWLDGTLLIDAWRDQPPSRYLATRAVSAGQHSLKVEYYEAAGGAVAQVNWQLAPSGGCPVGQYRAEYFANRTLSGTPAMTQCEPSVDYNWGTGGPTGVPADGFSVRWTGQHDFAGGTYTFTAWADDGIRVWLDGVLLIDAWRDQPPTPYQVTQAVAAGRHDVKVEYYDATGGAVARLSW